MRRETGDCSHVPDPNSWLRNELSSLRQWQVQALGLTRDTWHDVTENVKWHKPTLVCLSPVPSLLDYWFLLTPSTQIGITGKWSVCSAVRCQILALQHKNTNMWTIYRFTINRIIEKMYSISFKLYWTLEESISTIIGFDILQLSYLWVQMERWNSL